MQAGSSFPLFWWCNETLRVWDVCPGSQQIQIELMECTQPLWRTGLGLDMTRKRVRSFLSSGWCEAPALYPLVLETGAPVFCRSVCCGWKGLDLLFCSFWEHTLWQEVGWDHSLCPLRLPEDVQLTHGLQWGRGPRHLGGDLEARKTGREWYCSHASLHFPLCLLSQLPHRS